MKRIHLLLAAAPLALASPAFAQEASPQSDAAVEKEAKPQAQEVFSTGVAKGRSVLDSAISTSSLKKDEIDKLGARSLADVLRTIPGVRAESFGGEGNNSYSIRGLPLAAAGSKFLQLQEDGLPVLEFGDLQLMSSDVFMRVDSNLGQIEAIRGGSASTFASDSPGGVINLISKTGEVEGGSIAVTTGLDYGEYRLDFDYGGKLSDTLRYHIGGFYREGEGPRDVGYNAYRGGQLKFNITKELGGDNYIRVYGKYLDDSVPSYMTVPMRVTGTNDNPKYENLVNFDARKDSLVSRNIVTLPALDQVNGPTSYDLREGMHPIVKSLGLEAKYDLGGWTITEKFRYSDISGTIVQQQPLAVLPASTLAMANGGLGATLSFANGPHRGQPITASSLNGNGLLSNSLFINADLNSIDNMTNDLRATRVWEVGPGKLTTTIGFYKANQSFDTFWDFATALQDVVGNGDSSLVNVSTAGGAMVTQDGFTAFSVGSGGYHRRYDVNYEVNAPYASLNYHVGKLSIGGSLRYDMGKVSGTLYGSDLGGRGTGLTSYDFNGDGVLSNAERKTGTLPLTQPGLVDYDYHYLSYSVGVNYRITDSLAVFGRNSRGGRAAADRVLFTPAINYSSGGMPDAADGYDTVKQSEVGVKYRGSNIALNLTGFLATTGERNLQVNSKPDGSVQVEHIVRGYKAYGAEFEGSVRHGPFSLTVGATYTKAEISSDATNAANVGNTPRHQASLIYSLTPQFETRLFSIGANVVGATSSYAQDTNMLRLPGYQLVNAFVQVRPTDSLQLMINANNLFNTLAIGETSQGTMPASGIVLARAFPGRTISVSAKLDF